MDKPARVWGLTSAIWVAVMALVADAFVAIVEANNSQIIQLKEAEADRILEAIRSGNPDVAAENLEFLLRAGLVTDRATAQGLVEYLRKREPGEGAYLGQLQPAGPQESDRRTFEASDAEDLLTKYGIKPGEDVRPLTPRWSTFGSGNAK